MGKLEITRHERVEGQPFRWHVHLADRPHPLVVDLPEEERSRLDMSDDEIHDLLPTALQRRADQVREDDPERDAVGDAPVRVFQSHFTG